MSYRKNIQRGYRKSVPNPDSSVWLPRPIVDSISLDTHMGPRVDCPVLACFGWHYKMNRDRETVIKYSDGVKINVPRDMFVVSINTIAEDLFYRWFLRQPVGSVYKTFYEKIKKAVGRLKKAGHIKYLGYARAGRKGVFGSVWTMKGTPLGKMIDHCDPCVSSGMFIVTSTGNVYERDGFLNVIDIIGGRSIAKHIRDFRNVEMCGSYRRNPVYTQYLPWMNAVSTTQQRFSKHMTVGAFRISDLRFTDTAPAYLPHIVIDIDSHNPLDGYDSTARILTGLQNMGADLNNVLACPTGGSGYHICIPAGFFGNPIFSSSADSKRILSRFFEIFEENIDKSVFAGSHLIRMIGSKHEISGRYKNAYPGNVFLSMHPFELMGKSEGFQSFPITDPYNADPVPKMIMTLSEYAMTKTKSTLTGITRTNGREVTVSIPSFDEAEEFNEGMISRTVELALGEVAESEEWYSAKGYTGRSMALYVASCHYLRKYNNESLAWKALKENNQEFKTPPMNERELKGRFISALKSLGKRKRAGYSWALSNA